MTTRSPGRRRSRGRALALGSGAVAAALLLAACGDSGDSGDAPSSSGAETSAMPDGCEDYAAYAGHSGTSVSIFSTYLPPQSDNMQASWADFEECTGITINFEGSNDMESQLPVRVQGGTAPDLAILPQPALLASMVQTGQVVEPPAQVLENVQTNWNEAWQTYGSVDGTFYAAPFGSNAKSLVWYSPSTFEENGWAIPDTWDDLMTLSDVIAASGEMKPWCGGLGSGTATGWPATDWLEQVVLRQAGPDVYDQWIAHDIPFDSPEIRGAMETVAAWMKNPEYVNGGHGDVQSVATTTFQDAGLPILENQCAMLQQASFYATQFPEGTVVDPAGDMFAFYLPAMGSEFGKPIEGGGEFVAAFSDRPEVAAVQTYLTEVSWINELIKLSNGWVSANTAIDPENYVSPIDELSWTFLADPEATFRFDASDLMPAAVGSGAEWTQMTAWFAEDKPVAEVLTAIDAAWPTP